MIAAEGVFLSTGVLLCILIGVLIFGIFFWRGRRP